MAADLYKAFGVLWRTHNNRHGDPYITGNPLCSTDNCHSTLSQDRGGWFCVKCEKLYPCRNNYQTDHEHVQRMWEGHQTLGWDVYSLELPPTKVKGGDEDENYWVEARIGEKNGKKTALVYFGEKVRGEQDKTDYSQVFLDLEDEQLRFDRGNRNPMKILCKLTAEFQDSTIEQNKKL